MSKQEEAQKAWRNKYASFQGINPYFYLCAEEIIKDFKLALTKKIEKEMKDEFDLFIHKGLKRALQLLNEVKPLEP